MKTHKEIQRCFVKQHGDYSCGLACLSMIVNYYEGQILQEDLRAISGTTIQGTTLLGLYQAAEKINLKVEGCKGNMDALKKVESPTILHVLKNKTQEHFVVCFGYADGKFKIGDPSWGIMDMDEEELDAIWKSKALLMAEPTDQFVRKAIEKQSKLRFFTKVLQDDYPLLTVAFILGLLVSILGLSTAVFSQKLIDELLPGKEFDKIVVGIGIFFLLLLFRGFLDYLRNIFMARQNRDFNNRLIDKFYANILNLPKFFFDGTKTGEIVARMNDSRRIQQSITYIFGSTLIDVLILIISTIFLFFYSWQLALIASLCIPLFTVLVLIYNAKIITKQKAMMQAYALTESTFIDTIQGVSEIKKANKQTVFHQIIKAIYGFFQETAFNLNTLGAKYGFFTQLISVTVTITVISVGVIFVLDGNILLGELMATITIASMIISSTAHLSIVNIRLQEAVVAFNRYYEFIKIETEQDYGEDSKKDIEELESCILQINRMNFRFIGRKMLFSDITLEVKKGEMIALTGEVGSGKSTLLQLIQRNYRPESGEILFNRQSIHDYPLYVWRTYVGTVDQHVKIFNGCLGENICLDNYVELRDSVIRFCKEYGFDTFFDDFPQGIDTLLGEDGINLSGGQQQLVALARVLFRNPSLLLLDEPTSSMDSYTEEFVMKLLEKRRNQYAIILVTHKTNLTKYADRIYCLENGKINEVTVLVKS